MRLSWPRHLVTALLVAFVGAYSDGAAQQQKTAQRKPGLYAIFDTSMGTFACELFEKQAPKTVANFVGLAEGTREWLNLKGDFVKNRPFYNGLPFYRVERRFMIQAGDLTGTGTFQSVLPFDDEIVRTLSFDKPGMLAMANAGPPNTNTSQFFITVAPTPHLNRLHTIFGRVVEGFKVVEDISNVPVAGNKPIKEVVLRKLSIERIGGARQKVLESTR